MILTLVLANFLAQEAEPSPPEAAAVEREIAAMNSRLKNWNASLKMSDGTLTCFTRVSTGDPQIDDAACRAMSECAQELGGQTAAVNDPAVPKAKRKKLTQQLNGGMSMCVAVRRISLFRGLAERRLGHVGKVEDAAD